MGINFKKELVFGLIGLIVVAGAVIWGTGQYKKSMNVETAPTTQTQQSTTPGSTDSITQSAVTPSVKLLTMDEVTKHSNPSDCWFVVSGKVYNVTSYINSHPGGSMRITSNCGKDATQAYTTQGGKGSHSSAAYNMLKTLYIGDLNGAMKETSQTVQPSQNSQTAPAQNGESEDNEDE